MVDFIEEFIAKNKKIVLPAVSGVITGIYLVLCSVNVISALALMFTCAILYMLYKNIETSFLLYIILLPFGYAPFFDRLPFGISAVRLQLILSAIVVFLFILYKKPYKTKTVFQAFFIAQMILYCIAWVRSMNYALVMFSDNMNGSLPVYKYLLDYASWTFTVFLPLVIIAFYYRDQIGIERIIRTVAVSIILLLGYLLCIYVFQITDKSNFEVIRAELASFSGLHGNDLANYCILSFPLILSWALYKKGKFGFITLFLITAGTAICFSRTAYFLVLFGFFIFLFLSGRSRWIPVAAIVVGIALYFLVPDMVIDRAVTGLDSGNYDEISAGRIELIWQPILDELGSNPQIILFGSGRYGFTNTDAWKQGRVPAVLHAHNMYLDWILDVGILGLTVFIAFFLMVIIHFGKTAGKHRKTSPYYANLLNGCMVSVICYLISGFTGRSFFPTVANAYLWIVIGLGIAISSSLRASGLPAVSNTISNEGGA